MPDQVRHDGHTFGVAVHYDIASITGTHESFIRRAGHGAAAEAMAHRPYPPVSGIQMLYRFLQRLIQTQRIIPLPKRLRTVQGNIRRPGRRHNDIFLFDRLDF